VAFPKVFERAVAAPPDLAYAEVFAWLGAVGAKVTQQAPPQSVKAEFGKALRLASHDTARKIMVFELWPIPEGTFVRITMPLYWGYFDDAALMEDSITRSWMRFIDPLWVRFGYPPGYY
jgi:hypothetical protein